MTQDIRWIQRFSNYKKAFKNLLAAVELASERELSNLEKQGMIQAFEFTFELACNTIKDFFEYIRRDRYFRKSGCLSACL